MAKFGSHKYLASDYPAVHHHLVHYEQRLRSRGQVRYERSGGKSRATDYPGQHHWLELDNNPTDEYLGLFAGPKLVWMRMSPDGRFAYSDSEIYCNNLAFLMSGGPLKYLSAVLNGKLVSWMMQNTAVTTGMGLIEWVRFSVERIPIPQISAVEQQPFVELVDRIIRGKTADPDSDTAECEREIDQLVYDLYGLTGEEVEAVERALGWGWVSMEAAWGVVATLVAIVAFAAVGFLARTWIAARIQESVRLGYRKELEGYKNELKADNATFLEEIRKVNAQALAVQGAANASLVEGQRAAAEWRLKYADMLWREVLRLREEAPTALGLLDILNPNEFQEFITRSEFRDLALSIGADSTWFANPEIESVRPFLGERLFLLFFIYRAWAWQGRDPPRKGR